MAEPRGVNLDEDFVRLHVVQLDFAEFKLAVELGHYEGGGGSGHGGCVYGRETPDSCV